MRVGVIGAGNWGRNLVRAFGRLGVLSAVADVSPAIRSSVATENPGILVIDDFNGLIDSGVEAVAVATPAPTHFDIARMALLAGKDVFVEKPVALSSREVEELVRIAGERRRILMAGHLLLYQPAIRWIRDFLSSGAVGDVRLLTQERMKLGRARAAENVLWSFGVHDIAVLLHLVGGRPERVVASGAAVLQEGIEDDVHVFMDFAVGASANLHVSWLWPDQRRRLTIMGSRGMLTYDETTQEVVLHRKSISADLKNRDEGQEVVFRGDSEPLMLECEHFLECVRERKRPISDGESAIDVIAVLERATRALKGER